MTRRAWAMFLATGILLAAGLLAREWSDTASSDVARSSANRNPGPTAQEEGDIAIPSQPSARRPRAQVPPVKGMTRTTRSTRRARTTTMHRAEVPTHKDRGQPTNEAPRFPANGSGTAKTAKTARTAETAAGRSVVPPPPPEPESAPTPTPPAEPASPELALPRIPVLIPPVLLTRTAAYPDEAARIVLDRTSITPELRLVVSEGRVVLKILVREDGNVAEVQILSSSGYPVLDHAARAAAAAWQFRPATRDGVPIAAWAIVPVRFMVP